uniref:ChiQ/YbfN family lipoprotein n=1 Tax=Enterobacter bugandensis TaxID=881260 RepID=UPI0021751B84
AHEAFATQENVRVMDYQACIQARKTGNDQEVAKRCDKIWNEMVTCSAASAPSAW